MAEAHRTPLSPHVVAGLVWEAVSAAGFVAAALTALGGTRFPPENRGQGLGLTVAVAAAGAALACLHASMRHLRFLRGYAPKVRRSRSMYLVWLLVSAALLAASMRSAFAGRWSPALLSGAAAAYLFGVAFHVVPALLIGREAVSDALGRTRRLEQLTEVEVGPSRGDPPRAKLRLAAGPWTFEAAIDGGHRESVARRLRRGAGRSGL